MLCLSLFLLTILSSYSQNTLNNEQVKNIYIGLKNGDYYKEKFNQCFESSNKLGGIIVSQDAELQKSLVKLSELDKKHSSLNNEIVEQKLKIQALELKKTPFWRNPIILIASGFIAGILITK